MKKITYLFGAGASYHSLPLIKTMGQRMGIFSNYLKYLKAQDETPYRGLEPLINELDKLLSEENQSTSIDAYAKELSIKNQQLELHKLKMVLSSYLIFEQLEKKGEFFSNYKHNLLEIEPEVELQIKTTVDRRYRTFWGDYINDSNQLPSSNIKVISWNYDIQFEISYFRLKNLNLEAIQQELQIYPPNSKAINNDKFCLIKLNGTAGLTKNLTDKNFNNYFDFNSLELDIANLGILFSSFNTNFNRVIDEPIFSFAWENNSIAIETRKIAEQVINETNILIIVGYSFPSFNRVVDREIFKNINNVEKVYYQAPKDELSNLIAKLDGINSNLKDKVSQIDELNTFYIPNEF